MSVQFRLASTKADLEQISQLQQENLRINVHPDDIDKQGFVTLHHSLELLEKMNTPHPHVVAVDDDRVVGYALVTLPSAGAYISGLDEMFELLSTIRPIKDDVRTTDQYRYFIMGQVCIASTHRGRGVMKAMYDYMSAHYAQHFDFMITQIDYANPRSVAAHQRANWKDLHYYTNNKNEKWVISIRHF